jgi:dephospho-CoA kinase
VVAAEKKILIGTAGMPGAGKDTIKRLVQRLGLPVVVMGDEVRAEARRKGMAITPENLGKVMLQMRREDGPAAVAKKCIPKIKAISSSVVFVDGIRSLHEIEEFKKEFPDFRVLAVHASPKTRFKRLLRRGRRDDPRSWEGFLERDRRELRVGLGDVIATADYMVINEGTKRELEDNLIRLLRREVKEIWTSRG